MRSIIWLVLIFTVAVVAATTLGSNDGLVTFYWRGWRTDLSLNLFVILLLGGCLTLMSAVQALNSLLTLPKRASQWRAMRRERAAQAAQREALTEYFGGRYGRARKRPSARWRSSASRHSCVTTPSSASSPSSWPRAACTGCRIAPGAMPPCARP